MAPEQREFHLSEAEGVRDDLRHNQTHGYNFLIFGAVSAIAVAAWLLPNRDTIRSVSQLLWRGLLMSPSVVLILILVVCGILYIQTRKMQRYLAIVEKALGSDELGYQRYFQGAGIVSEGGFKVNIHATVVGVIYCTVVLGMMFFLVLLW